MFEIVQPLFCNVKIVPLCFCTAPCLHSDSQLVTYKCTRASQNTFWRKKKAGRRGWKKEKRKSDSSKVTPASLTAVRILKEVMGEWRYCIFQSWTVAVTIRKGGCCAELAKCLKYITVSQTNEVDKISSMLQWCLCVLNNRCLVSLGR